MDFSLDSKLPVDVVNSNNLAALILEALFVIISTKFTNYMLKFSRRQANGVTHELVHATPLEAGSQLFLDVRHCINNLLSNEMSLILG